MSVGKSVKFGISIKEFNVTFEGDITRAERMHGEIAGALTSLASAQKMLTATPKSAPPTVVVEPAGRRRGRRRRASAINVIDPAIIEGTLGSEPDAGAEDEV